jgi:hypothetical protein
LSLETLIKIIENDSFPLHVDNKIGEELKKIFESEEIIENNIKEAKKRYFYCYKEYKYILLEEFLFDEQDENLDYKRIIGRNFYLSRKNKKS